MLPTLQEEFKNVGKILDFFVTCKNSALCCWKPFFAYSHFYCGLSSVGLVWMRLDNY